jgi:hypothetical protein
MPVKADEIIDATKAAIADGEARVQRALDDLPRRKEPPPAPPPPPRAAEEDDGGAVMSVDQHIAHIRECAGRNRWATAGFGLIELRKWYEASDPTAFADDERTWPAFIAKRLPSIAPTEIDRLIGKVQYHGGALQCTRCGAEAVCHCGCGALYAVQHPWAAPPPAPAPKVSALERAAAAILAAPEKSDRAIAAEIGVGHQTVGRARRCLKAPAPLGPPLDQRKE